MHNRLDAVRWDREGAAGVPAPVPFDQIDQGDTLVLGQAEGAHADPLTVVR
jgi:hypothetical protein